MEKPEEVSGETPNMEKVRIYREAMTDFQNAHKFLLDTMTEIV